MKLLHTSYPLNIENSLTGEKEAFVPVHEGNVGMYVCGPTVYSDVHLGKFRKPGSPCSSAGFVMRPLMVALSGRESGCSSGTAGSGRFCALTLGA